MKMYLLIRDDIPVGKAIVAAAHASLAAYRKFEDTEDVKKWITGKFSKTVCKVNQREFDAAKKIDDNVVLTESTLDDQEVVIAFKPRETWPKFFQYLRLFR